MYIAAIIKATLLFIHSRSALLTHAEKLLQSVQISQRPDTILTILEDKSSWALARSLPEKLRPDHVPLEI